MCFMFLRFARGPGWWCRQWRSIQEVEDCVHQHPTSGAGEGISFQQVPLQTEAGGDSRVAGFNGEAGEGVVPEQAHEAQEADALQGEPRRGGEVRLPGRRAGGRV